MNSQVLLVFAVAAFAAVLASPVDNDKPAFSCPVGEVYEKCSQIHCYKKCDHLKNAPACPSVTPDCYNPACECDGNTLRDVNGVCIPSHKCPEYNPEWSLDFGSES